jgi:Signal peptidase, peptidase S26
MRTFVVGAMLLTGAMVSAQAPSFQRGEQVSVRKADGTAAEPAVQIVVALAGDRLRVDSTGAYVNDEKVMTLSPRVIEVLPRQTETIPTGHIFVAGEEHTGTTIGRAWNLIPVTRVSKVAP